MGSDGQTPSEVSLRAKLKRRLSRGLEMRVACKMVGVSVSRGRRILGGTQGEKEPLGDQRLTGHVQGRHPCGAPVLNEAAMYGLREWIEAYFQLDADKVMVLHRLDNIAQVIWGNLEHVNDEDEDLTLNDFCGRDDCDCYNDLPEADLDPPC